MSKAFVRETEDDDEAPLVAQAPAPDPARNYISPAGYARLRAELKQLVELERPEVVRTVSWAAKNGDRSENGDYLYGKKRLREIDRRVRFLIKRLEAAVVVESAGKDTDQIFFGATVSLKARTDGNERTVTIVGLDEVDPAKGRISWISPVAKALIKAREGDKVALKTPGGTEGLEILEVRYDPID
jgi:transcription elongation factor GreB